jgi:ATP-binding cassette subfamily G (WHITE) protein 2 (SNQ2)
MQRVGESAHGVRARDPCADSLQGVSGVSRLAAKPKLLLFLDEVCISFVFLLDLTASLHSLHLASGLDSQSAWAIMLFLQQLAANGQAILCTYVSPLPFSWCVTEWFS